MGPLRDGAQTRHRGPSAGDGDPGFGQVVAPADLVVPAGLDFTAHDFAAAGERTVSMTTRSARRSTTSTARDPHRR